VIGAAAAARVLPELASGKLGPRPLYLGTVTVGNGNHFDVLGHAWDGVLIVEFENVERSRPADFRHLYRLIGDFLLKVNESATIASLAQLAALHVRSVTGFGRVMVYQFDHDGHGHVLAEWKDQAYHSYLGQRFPAAANPVTGAANARAPALPPGAKPSNGVSAPWHSGEIELTIEFRTALLGIALERAEQMAELAEELGRANKVT
jgi:light-regulated signal transduction histidine kinase (bacteriophytochrome)